MDAIGHLKSLQGLQGFNRYAYVNNNPYKMVDPDGRGGAHPNAATEEKWLRTTPSGKASVKTTQLVAGFIPVLGDVLAVSQALNEAASGDIPVDNAATMAASKSVEIKDKRTPILKRKR